MKQLILILIIIANSLNGNAQYYNKRIVKDGWAATFNSCLLNGDTLNVSGLLGITTPNKLQKPLSCRFLNSGEFVFQVVDVADTALLYSTESKKSVRFADNVISIGSCGIGSPQKGYLSVKSLQLNTISFTEYGDTNRQTFSFSNILIGQDSFIYIAGWSQDKNGVIQSHLSKVDINGSVIWKKYYPSSLDNSPTELEQKSNGSIILVSEKKQYIPNENLFTQVNIWQVINEIDTANGSVFSTKQSLSDSMFGSIALIPTGDGGYITGNAKLDSLQEQSVIHHGYIAKLDSNYNTVWEKEIVNSYGISHFNKIKRLADGNYLAVGECMNFDVDSTVSYSNPLKGLYAGWLVKFNEDGNIIWDRKYYGIASFQEFNRLFDFAELPNGDIIACGESTSMYADSTYKQDSILQMGWLLRINANGCLGTNECGYTAIEGEVRRGVMKINIFPNPTFDKLNIETFQMDESQKYEFQIADITGKPIINLTPLFQNSSYIINTSIYSNGVYIITLFSNKEIISSQKIIKQ